MSKSQYAKHMAALSAKIFGEVSTATNERSMRVVKMFSERPLDKRHNVIEYYPRHTDISNVFRILRHYGLHRDEHEDFNEEMARKKISRGMGKPKKGEGKRAIKRKK